jgi:hypothetical protein
MAALGSLLWQIAQGPVGCPEHRAQGYRATGRANRRDQRSMSSSQAPVTLLPEGAIIAPTTPANHDKLTG